MKPTGRSLGHLMLAGTCLAWAGCGGSDVPDPSSDSAAASEPTAKPVDGAAAAEAAPAPAAESSPAPGAPGVMPASRGGRPEPVAAAPSAAPPGDAAPAVASADPAPPAGEPAATAETPKADTSGTDEMMRMAANPAPAAAGGDSSSTTTPAATPAPAPAGGMPAAGVMPRGNRSGEPDEGSRSVAQDATPATRPGGGDMPAAGVMPGMRPGGGEAGRRGGGGGGPAMASADGPGTSGGGNSSAPDPGPGAFRQPDTAVQAFLAALKAKDKDRLAQATARHAATESAERNRKLFATILDGSISDEELDDIAKKLEGFQVRMVLQAKSSGSFGVLIGKQDNRDTLQRTVTVRHEKEGWKVQDLSGVTDFKPVGTYRNPIGRRK